MINAIKALPNLSHLVDAVTAAWPEHLNFLQSRFNDLEPSHLELCEKLAGLINQITGPDLEDYCADYRWTCRILIQEDLQFRRTGHYRLRSFKDAEQEVYSNPKFMTPYLRGLLLSQVLWANQTRALEFYINAVLTRVPSNSSLLEIGPGHGILMYFAIENENIKQIVGWDISDSSLKMTEFSLQNLERDVPVSLYNVDIGIEQTSKATFDVVVMSELLEHLEDPNAAVLSIWQNIKPGGLLYINVPINSPAPDHIYNWSTTEAVEDMLIQSNFTIVDKAHAPMTGCSLPQAIAMKRTINVLAVGRKPPNC